MLSTEIIIRRLALIKYLYRIGEQQSKQAETIAGFSILSFHDCIEMFLLLVAENNNIKSENIKFMEFWEKFPNLTLKESMRAVKDRRVSAKHKGQFPSKADIDISRINVTDFLEQNSRIQFNIEFKDVSLLDLIKNEQVKDLLKGSQDYIQANNFNKSLIYSGVAFEQLIHFYESNKRLMNYSDIFDLGKEVGHKYEALVGRDDRSGYRWFKEITDTTNKLRDLLKITGYGIDYRQYSVFKYLIPKYYKDSNNEYIILPSSKCIKMTLENCQFCIDFVIESAIILQKFDFDINDYVETVKRFNR